MDRRFWDNIVVWVMIHAQAILLTATFLALVGGAAWFYSATEDTTAVVESKWMDTSVSTTCDENGKNCRTTTTRTYYVQMEDGKIYNVLWGTLQWDRMQPGSEIHFTARGRHLQLWGWRTATPTITWYEFIVPQ